MIAVIPISSEGGSSQLWHGTIPTLHFIFDGCVFKDAKYVYGPFVRIDGTVL